MATTTKTADKINDKKSADKPKPGKPATEPKPVKATAFGPGIGAAQMIDLNNLDGTPAQSGRANKPAEDAVEELQDAYKSGRPVPPPQVFGYKCDRVPKFFLADGAHRVEALVRNKQTQAECYCKWCGSKAEAEREAYKFALGANTTHGVKRSNEDKRKAVVTALSRPEYAGATVRVVADACGVSHQFVSTVQSEIGAGNSGLNKPPVVKSEPQSDAGVPHQSEASEPEPRRAADALPPERATAHQTDQYVDTLDDDELDDEPIADDVVVPVDQVGTPIPPHLLGVFEGRKAFKMVHEYFVKGVGHLKDLAASSSGGFIEVSVDHLGVEIKRKVLASLKLDAPYAVCPNGDHTGGAARKPCSYCRDRGWVNKLTFENMSKERRTGSQAKLDA